MRLRGTRSETLVVDYVIHYPKASGRTTTKVFKWRVVEALPGAEVRLTKRQILKDFTTRRHHPGVHRVQLQVNGRRLAETDFRLRG